MSKPRESLGSVHFSVDGPGLTRILRGFFEEGRSGHAIRTVLLGIPGVTLEQAFELLTGKKRLENVTDSDEVKLVDDAEVSTYVYGDDNLPTSLDGLCRRLDWYEKKRELIDCLEEASAMGSTTSPCEPPL